MRLTPLTPRTREFRERGFVRVSGLLSPARVEAYVEHLERLSGRTRAWFERGRRSPLARLARRGVVGAWTLPDGVTRTREFWDLALLPGLVELVRELLGRGACFLQHTDLHAGFSAVGWHRDSVNRRLGSGGDWDESEEPYRLARVGFYFQTHAESGFALGFVPGSHRRGVLSDAELRELDRRTSPLAEARRLLLGEDRLTARAEWVKAEAGDAVIFDPRILHTGSFISGPKFSAFPAYGNRGRHFARHLRYYRELRPDLGYAPIDPALVGRLREAALLPREQVQSAAAAEPRAYLPGRVQRLLARSIRPGAPPRA